MGPLCLAMAACGGEVVELRSEPDAGDCTVTVPPEPFSACAVEQEGCVFDPDDCLAPTLKCIGGNWQQVPGDNCFPCPAQLPMSGTSCPHAGDSCSYSIDSECGPLDYHALCTEFGWSIQEPSDCDP